MSLMSDRTKIQEQLPESVRKALAEGRAREQARQEKAKAEGAAMIAAADKHWQALRYAVSHDLGDLCQYVTMLLERPEDFSGPDAEGCGCTTRYIIRFEVPGIGEIARRYHYDRRGNNEEWRWAPDNRWFAVTYERRYGADYDDGLEGARISRETDWQMRDNLADVLVEAERQYARRNEILLEAERINTSRTEKKAVSKPVPTTEEKLLEALSTFIREHVPEVQ